MSKFERRATPLSELDGKTTKIGKKRPTTFVVDIQHLPSEVKKEEILFDLSAIRRRSRLGGISEIHIVDTDSKNKAQRLSSHPDVMGEPASNYPGNFPKAAQWIKMTSSIDVDAIASRNPSEQSTNSFWAAEINRALSNDLFDRGIDHLMEGIRPKIELMVPTLIGAYLSSKVQIPELIVAYQLTTHFFWNLLERAQIKPDLNGFRWSFFGGVQLDRAEILEIMQLKERIFKQQKLVRALA